MKVLHILLVLATLVTYCLASRYRRQIQERDRLSEEAGRQSQEEAGRQTEEGDCVGDPDISRWRIECNWCRCVNGKGSCTRKGCPHTILQRLINTPECEGSPTWQRDCNTCTCDNGRARCTTKTCGAPLPGGLLESGRCVPGTSWYDGCNTCGCQEDGTVGSCTTRECPPSDIVGTELPPPAYTYCKPGSRWMKDCNWCTCGKDGSGGACTLIGCLPNYKPQPGQAVCTEGSRWKQDNCNWCNCNNGKASCTEKLCVDTVPDPELPRPPIGTVCVPRSRWHDGCNSCVCREDGSGSVCTLRACPPPADLVVTDPPPPAYTHCKPGSRWMMNCNWCSCTNNGANSACAMKGCPPNYKPRPGQVVCTERSHWKQDNCNWCNCKNGKAFCTEKLCIQTDMPKKSCIEGSSWKQDCNTCHCINGTAGCTKKLCAEPVPETLQCTGNKTDGCVDQLPPHCKLPPFNTEGHVCLAFLSRWTYVADTQNCENIIYGGCGGTKNLYHSQAECEASCRPLHSTPQPAQTTRTNTKRSTKPQRCFLKADSGHCFGYFIKFTYNSASRQCKEFVYGGCGGNRNRFETLQECQTTCGSSCDRSKCPWLRWAHYFAKNCLPQYERGSCCPTRFLCPSTNATDPEKCYYKGEAYTKGSTVPVEDACSANCYCTESYAPGYPAEIHCADIECPEFFRPPVPGCRPVYKPGECCSSESDCVDPDTPPLLESRSVTCVWNNKTYLAGDKMYFDDFPCQKCICSPAFTRPDGPLCTKENCGFDFRYTSKFAEGCVPIYFEEKCCPVDWLCPGDSRIPLTASQQQITVTKENPQEARPLECYLGDLSIALASPLNTSECSINCKCITPPEPTCVLYRSCTLAEEVKNNQECVEPSCSPGCDVIMDAVTGCLACSCNEDNFICPQKICPRNCENIFDLQTGCPSCKCNCSYDSATGTPCPVDCVVHEVVDELTGCKRCECDPNSLGSPVVQRQVCPVNFTAPCPMDCAVIRILDEETGCEKCECDPNNPGDLFGLHQLPRAHYCPTDHTGKPPCPMDCAIHYIVDEETGCEKCECDPNNPDNPFGLHQLPRAHYCPTDHTGKPPCPMDCAIHYTVDEETGCEKCECDPNNPANPFGLHQLPPPLPQPSGQDCPIDHTGKLPCPMDCAIHYVVDKKTGCEKCECDPNIQTNIFGLHLVPLPPPTHK
ncbi:kielin/chordin-like protein isoform X2 [Cherax quadricarinatus]|uniref:kielin/chordin-like protein isoform X2 n=1 Tax=Cherax quadricarinatus TaxID=27406 RepID=UPI00387E3547